MVHSIFHQLFFLTFVKKHSNSGIIFPSKTHDKIIFPKVLNACPLPIGTKIYRDECNKRFVEDLNGVIKCQDDLDCPQNEGWFIENGCSDQEILTVGFCVTFDCLDGKCKEYVSGQFSFAEVTLVIVIF